MDGGERVLADCLTDESGCFAMGVPAIPPFTVRVRGSDDPQVRIEITPSLSEKLLVETPPPRRETLHVKPVWEHAADDEHLLVHILNDQAQVIQADNRKLADSPWRFHDAPFGTYDVKVFNRRING